jgi:TATA-box binding protein (TBP) (component of TFIID and TFIIIB)
MKSWKMSMVNFNLKLGDYINIIELSSYLNNNRYKCIYEPEKYAGLRIKWKSSNTTKDFSAIVFATGKVILPGMQSHKDVKCYDELIKDILKYTI